MHFRAWLSRIRAWFSAILQRWWILALIFLYKVGEDRILGEINDQLEGREGFAFARWVVNAIPEFTLWLLIPVVLGILLWRSYADSKPMPVPAKAPRAASESKRVTREHDGMEWEYAGRNADPRGPFCLDDHTPLAFVDVRSSGPGPKVVPYYRHDLAHLGGYWGFLHCLDCGKDYGKDAGFGYKTVEQSQNEVQRIFEGMENRGEL